MDLGSFGPILALGLGAVGSAVGCGIAGMTSHGIMSKVDEGHAKFVALSAMPASQSIYGFVLMIMLNLRVKELLAAGQDTSYIFAIGFAAGTALMMSAIYQGKACSSAILAVSKKPSAFGMSVMSPAMIEGFAIFSLVGGILLR